MYKTTIRHAAFLGLLFITSIAFGDETVTRNYTLSNNGSFQLQVPRSWSEEVRQSPMGLPPTIVFTPKSGTSFQILVTPMFSVREDMRMPNPAEIRMHIQRAADEAKSQAVEQSLPIRELKGTSSIGYYFSATDRAPKPGEYKFMTQGMTRIGDLAPTFTILSNDGAGDVVNEALSMLKDAAHVKNTQ